MDTKSKVLELLEKKRGVSLSGQKIAVELGVSRTAVWKSIKALQSEGHLIGSATNRGYMLSPDSHILSEESVRALLTVKPERVFIHNTLESTNITAKELAMRGAAHGTAVIAERQTAGRGRMGRAFLAPPDSGLYMSVVLYPRIMGVASATWMTAAAAVAVCEAVEAVTGGLSGGPPVIKWVNDVFVGGKKVCGILTEAITDVESGRADWAVTGIGINISSVPDGLEGVAGAILPGNRDASVRVRLAAELLNRLAAPNAWGDVKALRAAYKKRLFMLGQTVGVILPNETYDAVALDVDAEGRLLVERPDGTRAALLYGEVSLRAGGGAV
ncbi:MAG: biotin--[acetyl-CoA-carboxylase] ligase [Oscillospiraceae bacterium]|nr:biotin--[acetyl-CoA-carboxylase] ligase [Oscillospiraceae bacterium]